MGQISNQMALESAFKLRDKIRQNKSQNGNQGMSSCRRIISIILKVIVVVFAVTGTILSVTAGNEKFMGGTTVLMYFTIQSNLALAVVCAVGFWLLISYSKIPEWWYVVKYVAAMAITVTGLVFAFMLAPTMGDKAWTVVNIFTHVIVPLASVIDFFLVGIDAELKMKSVIFTTIPPLLYAIYAGIGYALNWQFAKGINYPYFFLNWGSPAGAFGFTNELPFLGCAWWILILLVLILGIGSLYLVALNKIRKIVKK